MGVYKTSKWLDRLWREHLEVSTRGRELVQQGVAKQGPSFAGFPADIHARLYLPSDPERLDTDADADWAVQLHDQASELGEWHQLRVMCSRNGFAAAIAAETMLEVLLPLVPTRSEIPAGQAPAAPSTDLPPAGPGAGQPSEQNPEDAAAHEAPPPDEAKLRAALRRAARAARDAVNDAETMLDGVGTSLGFTGSGSATIRSSNPADLQAIRDAHSRLSGSKRLRRIAQLAGRMERVAASKARSRIRPCVGEVHGVGLGGDIARLLPSELVGLRHPRLRLVTLARIVERRAQVYSMQGREPCARGPIVVLLDESSSMTEQGKDVWSKAVALALLSTSTRQKRAWHLVAFNGDIVREVEVRPGRATPADIQDALDHNCRGGTDFDPPLRRAIEVIRTSRTMHAADVVIITDGQDSLSPSVVKAATELTRTEGVSFYVIGVGPDADDCVQSLGSIATSMAQVYHVSHGDGDADIVVDIINLERKPRAA